MTTTPLVNPRLSLLALQCYRYLAVRGVWADLSDARQVLQHRSAAGVSLVGRAQLRPLGVLRPLVGPEEDYLK